MKTQEKFNLKDKKPSLFQVCFLFFYMGLTTFGGASSMLLCLTRELVQKRGWLTEDELYEEIAVSQVSPGIIMVNTATLIGTQTYGILGGILSTLSLLIAPFTFISIITLLLKHFTVDLLLLSNIYSGIRASLCALSITALIRLIKKNIVDVFTAILAVLAFVSIVVLNVKGIFVVIAGIIIGIVASYIKELYKKHKKSDNNG